MGCETSKRVAIDPRSPCIVTVRGKRASPTPPQPCDLSVRLPRNGGGPTPGRYAVIDSATSSSRHVDAGREAKRRRSHILPHMKGPLFAPTTLLSPQPGVPCMSMTTATRTNVKRVAVSKSSAQDQAISSRTFVAP